MNGPGNFVVYKSSAGSGKTHTLVKEYIGLVIENPDAYRNILSITFTNKAANEMKGRILADLKRLAVPAEHRDEDSFGDLLNTLISGYHLTEVEIAKRAERVLSNILHNYSGFAVSTIDSFVHKLVRHFARDLNLPLNFDVELDTDKLISKAIDLLISKVGTDKALTNVLVRFVRNKMEDELSWNIERNLNNFARILLNEDSYIAIDKLKELEIKDFVEMAGQLTVWIRNFEKEIVDLAAGTHNLIKETRVNASSFYRGQKGISTYFKNLAGRNFDKIMPNSYVISTVEDDKWFSSKCLPNEMSAINSIKGQIKDAYTLLQERIEQDYGQYKLFRLILENLYPIAVLNAIEEVIGEFRENENIVHIAEFNRRIALIVGKEHIPFIYERIGEQYQHYMIDEFQDTSLLQWQNMIPLYENALGSNRFNMIVGDGKQAIYRFRNGDAEQFVRLPQIGNTSDDPFHRHRQNLFTSQYTGKVLDTNYRSGENIVMFNNRFFKFAGQLFSEKYRPFYDDVEQKPHRKGGSVQIEFMDHQGLKKEEFVPVEHARLLQLINTDLATIPLKDIAILTRTNDEGSKIARFLLENGIRVISADALFLSSSAEVRFIIAFLSYLNDKNNNIPVAEMMTYLLDNGKITFPSLNDVLDHCFAAGTENQQSRIEQVLQSVNPALSIRNLKNTTLYQTVESLVRLFHLDPDGNNPFLIFFLDEIQEFLSKYNDDLSEFLKYWEEIKNKRSIIVPEGIEAVQVMTIHKAKGLQFPVVIYPFAESTVTLTKKYRWVEPDLKLIPQLKTTLLNLSMKKLEKTGYEELYEEESQKSFLDLVNLLYVTMTRPENHLYILTKDKTDKNKGGWKESSGNHDIPDLFYLFLCRENIWQEGQRTYTFGDLPQQGVRQKETPSQPASKTKGKENFGEWYDKMIAGRKGHQYRINRATDENIKWGEKVHALMSRISAKSDVDDVLDNAMSEGLLSEEEKASLKEKILALINQPQISPLFEAGNKVVNEKDILLPGGKTLRPDRLTFKDDTLFIIDYKTGKEEEKHFRQINEYASVMKMMGYEKIKKYLLYINEERVLEA